MYIILNYARKILFFGFWRQQKPQNKQISCLFKHQWNTVLCAMYIFLLFGMFGMRGTCGVFCLKLWGFIEKYGGIQRSCEFMK